MEKLLISVGVSILFWVVISLIVSTFRSRKSSDKPSSSPTNNEHLNRIRRQRTLSQAEIAQKAVLTGLQLGCSSAKECAELTLGRSMAPSEWAPIKEPWEQAWLNATAFGSDEDFKLQIETFLLAKTVHGATTAKEAAYIAASEYSNCPMTEAEWNNRKLHFERLWSAITEVEDEPQN